MRIILYSGCSCFTQAWNGTLLSKPIGKCRQHCFDPQCGAVGLSYLTLSFLNLNRHLGDFYRSSGYNTTDPTREVQAFQLLRFHRNPTSHGLEHAVPAGPAEASTIPVTPLPADELPWRFKPRAAAKPGDVVPQPEFTRWEISLMQYSIEPLFLHSLERAMHFIGELEGLHVEFLFAYPTF